LQSSVRAVIDEYLHQALGCDSGASHRQRRLTILVLKVDNFGQLPRIVCQTA